MEIKELERQADILWENVIRMKFKNRCFFCAMNDRNAFPPHSAHHIIKRRFLHTRWDPSNGLYLCAGHHAEVELKKDETKTLLEFTFKNSRYAEDRLMIEDMLTLIDKNKNPPSVRFTFLEMQDIICDLEKRFEMM